MEMSGDLFSSDTQIIDIVNSKWNVQLSMRPFDNQDKIEKKNSIKNWYIYEYGSEEPNARYIHRKCDQWQSHWHLKKKKHRISVDELEKHEENEAITRRIL